MFVELFILQFNKKTFAAQSEVVEDHKPVKRERKNT